MNDLLSKSPCFPAVSERTGTYAKMYEGFLREFLCGPGAGRVSILKIKRVESFWKLAAYPHNGILKDNEEKDFTKWCKWDNDSFSCLF